MRKTPAPAVIIKLILLPHPTTPSKPRDNIILYYGITDSILSTASARHALSLKLPYGPDISPDSSFSS